MSLTKKNTGRKSSVKKAAAKPVIITKSKVAAAESLFTKKVKQINTLLGKSTLLPS